MVYAAVPPAPPAPPAPPLVEADLVKSVYLGTAPLIKSVDKNAVAAAAAAPAAAASASVAVQTNATTNTVATVGE